MRTDWVDGEFWNAAAVNSLAAEVNSGGDASGPAGSVDNAVVRFNGTTGKLLQSSAVTIGDDGLITTAVSTGNGLRVTSTQGVGTGSDNLVYVETTNSAWDRPLLRIVSNSAAGGAADIRIDSPNPDIEFVESDQTSPAGKFEIAINSDTFQINGRNATDSSFEPIAVFRRYANGGTMGLGTLFDIPNAMLEIVKVAGKDHLSCSTAVAGGGDILKVAETGDVVINDRGASVDVRVEGDTNANLLFIDGSADCIGIKTSTPLLPLHVNGRAQFGTASVSSGTIDLANSGSAGLTRISPGAPGSDVTVTLPATATTLVGTDTTNTLTNKRWTPRIGTTAGSATPSIDCVIYDQYNITALNVAITSVTITGTAFDGQRLAVRIKDNGTLRAIAWGASFVAGPAALLTTTAAGKTHYNEFVYDSVATKWVCILSHTAGY